MGVSPKLVVGAWVGGEYRCIHFRTGALGQGSRTALPICGYFLQSVFGDPAFKEYHGKFKMPEDAEIDKTMFECSYSRRVRNDTINSDSADHFKEVILDDEGNPIEQESKSPAAEGATEHKQHPKEIDVNFDDL